MNTFKTFDFGATLISIKFYKNKEKTAAVFDS